MKKQRQRDRRRALPQMKQNTAATNNAGSASTHPSTPATLASTATTTTPQLDISAFMSQVLSRLDSLTQAIQSLTKRVERLESQSVSHSDSSPRGSTDGNSNADRNIGRSPRFPSNPRSRSTAHTSPTPNSTSPSPSSATATSTPPSPTSSTQDSPASTDNYQLVISTRNKRRREGATTFSTCAECHIQYDSADSIRGCNCCMSCCIKTHRMGCLEKRQELQQKRQSRPRHIPLARQNKKTSSSQSICYSEHA